jgi:hypothetical protein
VASNHIENSITQDKTVAETSFVANRREENVFPFGIFLTVDSTHIFEHAPTAKENKEHLIHVDEAIL